MLEMNCLSDIEFIQNIKNTQMESVGHIKLRFNDKMASRCLAIWQKLSILNKAQGNNNKTNALPINDEMWKIVKESFDENLSVSLIKFLSAYICQTNRFTIDEEYFIYNLLIAAKQKKFFLHETLKSSSAKYFKNIYKRLAEVIKMISKPYKDSQIETCNTTNSYVNSNQNMQIKMNRKNSNFNLLNENLASKKNDLDHSPFNFTKSSTLCNNIQQNDISDISKNDKYKSPNLEQERSSDGIPGFNCHETFENYINNVTVKGDMRDLSSLMIDMSDRNLNELKNSEIQKQIPDFSPITDREMIMKNTNMINNFGILTEKNNFGILTEKNNFENKQAISKIYSDREYDSNKENQNDETFQSFRQKTIMRDFNESFFSSNKDTAIPTLGDCQEGTKLLNEQPYNANNFPKSEKYLDSSDIKEKIEEENEEASTIRNSRSKSKKRHKRSCSIIIDDNEPSLLKYNNESNNKFTKTQCVMKGSQASILVNKVSAKCFKNNPSFGKTFNMENTLAKKPVALQTDRSRNNFNTKTENGLSTNIEKSFDKKRMVNINLERNANSKSNCFDLKTDIKCQLKKNGVKNKIVLNEKISQNQQRQCSNMHSRNNSKDLSFSKLWNKEKFINQNDKK